MPPRKRNMLKAAISQARPVPIELAKKIAAAIFMTTISERTCEPGTDCGAQKCAGHGEAKQPGDRTGPALYGIDSAIDDGRIEAKKKPSHRGRCGDKCNLEDSNAVHRRSARGGAIDIDDRHRLVDQRLDEHDEISLNCSLVESANPATKQFFASLRVGHQPGRRHWAVPQVAGHPAHR